MIVNLNVYNNTLYIVPNPPWSKLQVIPEYSRSAETGLLQRICLDLEISEQVCQRLLFLHVNFI